MTLLKYIIIGTILFIALVVNGTLRYITPALIESCQNSICQRILILLSSNKFLTAAIATSIAGSPIILGIILYPRNYINRIKRIIVKRIHKNLFESNIRNHRVSLFKEIGYMRAFWRYICAVCYHLRPRYICKFWIHLKNFPTPGNYLIVDTREGSYKKSRTMFPVEENKQEQCRGVVGLIRFQKAICIRVPDLPDIAAIDLSKLDLSNTRRGDTKIVLEYMTKGYMPDLESLKRLHIKARHFLGSVIYKRDGNPCGILLVDSTAHDNPFNDAIIDKFRVYGDVLTDLLS